MEEPLERKAVISGAAQSDIGRRLNRSGLDLTIESVLWAVDDAGLTIDEIFNLTKIDRWFLVQIQQIVDCEEELASISPSE